MPDGSLHRGYPWPAAPSSVWFTWTDCQGPDFEEDLSCIILLLADKCYLPALVWYRANV